MTDPIALYLPVFTPTLIGSHDRPHSLRARAPLALDFGQTDQHAPEFEAPDLEASEFEVPDFEASDELPSEQADDDFAPPQEDEGTRIAKAREEAMGEAAIATEAALAAQAAELEGRHAATLAEALVEERRLWVERESTVMAEQLRTGLAALEKVLAEAVVEILQPVLARGVRAQAAEELRAAVTQILATPDAPVIRIGGPSDLVDPLRSAFAAEAAIEIVASESPEVTVEAGDTTIRTQLQSWASTLDSHLDETN